MFVLPKNIYRMSIRKRDCFIVFQNLNEKIEVKIENERRKEKREKVQKQKIIEGKEKQNERRIHICL